VTGVSGRVVKNLEKTSLATANLQRPISSAEALEIAKRYHKHNESHGILKESLVSWLSILMTNNRLERLMLSIILL
jgi:hypothetical protein